eukprot:GHVP01052466.1.p1 GENE.GHVP01052466.1~~GHVP01052466.1.p1  ORF type:complete len:1646 (+),score=266.60 GHVP01052466.1:27-4964(+)
MSVAPSWAEFIEDFSYPLNTSIDYLVINWDQAKKNKDDLSSEIGQDMLINLTNLNITLLLKLSKNNDFILFDLSSQASYFSNPKSANQSNIGSPLIKIPIPSDSKLQFDAIVCDDHSPATEDCFSLKLPTQYSVHSTKELPSKRKSKVVVVVKPESTYDVFTFTLEVMKIISDTESSVVCSRLAEVSHGTVSENFADLNTIPSFSGICLPTPTLAFSVLKNSSVLKIQLVKGHSFISGFDIPCDRLYSTICSGESLVSSVVSFIKSPRSFRRTQDIEIPYFLCLKKIPSLQKFVFEFSVTLTKWKIRVLTHKDFKQHAVLDGPISQLPSEKTGSSDFIPCLSPDGTKIGMLFRPEHTLFISLFDSENLVLSLLTSLAIKKTFYPKTAVFTNREVMIYGSSGENLNDMLSYPFEKDFRSVIPNVYKRKTENSNFTSGLTLYHKYLILKTKIKCHDEPLLFSITADEDILAEATSQMLFDITGNRNFDSFSSYESNALSKKENLRHAMLDVAKKQFSKSISELGKESSPTLSDFIQSVSSKMYFSSISRFNASNCPTALLPMPQEFQFGTCFAIYDEYVCYIRPTIYTWESLYATLQRLHLDILDLPELKDCEKYDPSLSTKEIAQNTFLLINKTFEILRNQSLHHEWMAIAVAYALNFLPFLFSRYDDALPFLRSQAIQSMESGSYQKLILNFEGLLQQHIDNSFPKLAISYLIESFLMCFGEAGVHVVVGCFDSLRLALSSLLRNDVRDAQADVGDETSLSIKRRLASVKEENATDIMNHIVFSTEEISNEASNLRNRTSTLFQIVTRLRSSSLIDTICVIEKISMSLSLLGACLLKFPNKKLPIRASRSVKAESVLKVLRAYGGSPLQSIEASLKQILRLSFDCILVREALNSPAYSLSNSSDYLIGADFCAVLMAREESHNLGPSRFLKHFIYSGAPNSVLLLLKSPFLQRIYPSAVLSYFQIRSQILWQYYLEHFPQEEQFEKQFDNCLIQTLTDKTFLTLFASVVSVYHFKSQFAGDLMKEIEESRKSSGDSQNNLAINSLCFSIHLLDLTTFLGLQSAKFARKAVAETANRHFKNKTNVTKNVSKKIYTYLFDNSLLQDEFAEAANFVSELRSVKADSAEIKHMAMTLWSSLFLQMLRKASATKVNQIVSLFRNHLAKDLLDHIVETVCSAIISCPVKHHSSVVLATRIMCAIIMDEHPAGASRLAYLVSCGIYTRLSFLLSGKEVLIYSLFQPEAVSGVLKIEKAVDSVFSDLANQSAFSNVRLSPFDATSREEAVAALGNYVDLWKHVASGDHVLEMISAMQELLHNALDFSRLDGATGDQAFSIPETFADWKLLDTSKSHLSCCGLPLPCSVTFNQIKEQLAVLEALDSVLLDNEEVRSASLLKFTKERRQADNQQAKFVWPVFHTTEEFLIFLCENGFAVESLKLQKAINPNGKTAISKIGAFLVEKANTYPVDFTLPRENSIFSSDLATTFPDVGGGKLLSVEVDKFLRPSQFKFYFGVVQSIPVKERRAFVMSAFWSMLNKAPPEGLRKIIFSWGYILGNMFLDFGWKQEAELLVCGLNEQTPKEVQEPLFGFLESKENLAFTSIPEFVKQRLQGETAVNLTNPEKPRTQKQPRPQSLASISEDLASWKKVRKV